MKKDLYSKKNQENILNEFIGANKRPDLSYLTQAKFEREPMSNFILIDKSAEIVSTEKYKTAIEKLPQLVQCAEILFDLTSSNPESINHKIVSDLLNSLKP